MHICIAHRLTALPPLVLPTNEARRHTRMHITCQLRKPMRMYNHVYVGREQQPRVAKSRSRAYAQAVAGSWQSAIHSATARAPPLHDLGPAGCRLPRHLPPSPPKLTPPCLGRRRRNPSIEKWAKFKEDYHLRFRYTPRRVFDLALWGCAVPLGVYWLLKNEQVCARGKGRCLGLPWAAPCLGLPDALCVSQYARMCARDAETCG